MYRDNGERGATSGQNALQTAAKTKGHTCLETYRKYTNVLKLLPQF